MIDRASLAELESRVRDSLRTGDESGLDVIGYGEVSTVLRWPPGTGDRACKRLPRFASRAPFDAYAALFEETIAAMRDAGIDVVDSELHTLEEPDGSVTAYCVQPLLPGESLGPSVLRAADPTGGAHPMLPAIASAVQGFCTAERGIDGQVSNWAWDGGRLRYLDVTTPFVRDTAGRWRLDLAVFGASLPALVRAPVLRFVLPGIEAKYHDPRHVLLDMAGNLHKERLAAWVPVWLEVANEVVDPPITADEVRRFYASDARTWAVMQSVRRLDRWWQRRVRRRTYPVLLPGPIAR